MRALFLAPVVVMLAGPTVAANRCMVKAVADTAAIDHADSQIARGKLFGPVTSVEIDKATSTTSYCGHGSFCYPAGGFAFITPCSISPDPENPNPDILSFSTK